VPLHLLKICVGVDSIAELADWQARRSGAPKHYTRFYPKRAAEILKGGSLYWIIRGFVQVRQEIRAFDMVERPGKGLCCAITMDKRLVRTEPQPRRPHQGWRYLDGDDAPLDLKAGKRGQLPVHLMADLKALGLL
jgi:hypothetical protein